MGERTLKGIPGSWELLVAGTAAEAPIVAGNTAPQPRPSDRVTVVVARRAPGTLRAVNRLANAAQRRRLGGSPAA